MFGVFFVLFGGFFFNQMLKDFEQIYPEVPKQKPADKDPRYLVLPGSTSGLGFQPICQVSFGEEGECMSKAEVVLGKVAQRLQKDLPLG